jgi:hypothetical protein
MKAMGHPDVSPMARPDNSMICDSTNSMNVSAPSLTHQSQSKPIRLTCFCLGSGGGPAVVILANHVHDKYSSMIIVVWPESFSTIKSLFVPEQVAETA